MNLSEDSNLVADDAMNTTILMMDQSSDAMDVITYCICCVGLLLNTLSIIATANIPHRQTTHSKLIISLGVSDNLIILGVVCHYLITVSGSLDNCTELGEKFFINTALLATLTNLLAMAFDHYFAIMKPLHYRRFMTRYRGNCLILMIWMFSLIGGLLDVFIGMMIQMDRENFCWTILMDDFEFEQVIQIISLVVLVGIVIIYLKIYSLVKKLMSRDQMLYQDEMHSHKAIVTTFLIIGTFALCWTPNCLFQIIMSVKVRVDIESVQNNMEVIITVHKILFAILLSNSLCDPIIYAMRLSEVQKGYRQILYKICPHRRFNLNEEEYRNLHPDGSSDRRRSTSPTLLIDTNISVNDNSNNKLSSHLENNLPANISIQNSEK